MRNIQKREFYGSKATLKIRKKLYIIGSLFCFFSTKKYQGTLKKIAGKE